MPGPYIIQTGAQLQGPILSVFVPKLNLIQNMDVALTATVTTVTDHGYETDQLIKINVPPTYRMSVLQNTRIVVLSPTTFLTDINTLDQQTFTPPTLYPPIAFTPAQCIPITGEERNAATPEV